MKKDFETIFTEEFEKEMDNVEAEIKRKDRKELFNKALSKSYYKTFIESVENAANRKYAKGDIDKIVIDAALNVITNIRFLDKDGEEIKTDETKKIKEKIMDFYTMKKKANELNSDRRFHERKGEPPQKVNLYNRSLGEEVIFNY